MTLKRTIIKGRLIFFIIFVTAYLIACGGGGGTPGGGGEVVATFETTKIPRYARNSIGDIAWQVKSGEDSGIFIYSNNTTTKISPDGRKYYFSPRINDNGQVIWVQSNTDNTGFELIAYKNGQSRIVDACDILGPNPRQNNDDTIVWCRVISPEHFGINIDSNGQTKRLTQSRNNVLPQINDSGQIIWFGFEPVNQINVFSCENEIVRQVSNDNMRYIEHAILKGPRNLSNIDGDGNIVWVGRSGYDNLLQIYYYNGITVTNPSNGLGESKHPHMAANGMVVWETFEEEDTSHDLEIYAYRDGQLTKITDNGFDDEYPQVNSHGAIVWQGFDGQDYEIFRYRRGQIIQLTDNQVDDVYPRVMEDGAVFWLRREWNEEGWVYTSLVSKTFPSHSAGVSIPAYVGKLARSAYGIIAQSNILEKFSFTRAAYAEESNEKETEEPVLTFWVTGDSRGKDGCVLDLAGTVDMIAEEWIQGFAQYAKEQKPDALFFLGDFACLGSGGFPRRSGHYIRNYWLDFMNPAIEEAQIPFYPIIGNHDLYKAWNLPGIGNQEAFQEIFGFGDSDKIEYDIRGTKDGFSYLNWFGDDKFGALAYAVYHASSKALFIILDSDYIEDNGDYYGGKISPEQLDILLDDIPTSTIFQEAKFVFVMAHDPVFNINAPIESQPISNSLLELWKWIDKYNINAFYSGHVHLFSYKKIDELPYDSDTTFRNSIPHYIVGAGGVDPDPLSNPKVTNFNEWNIMAYKSFCEVSLYEDGSTETTCWGDYNNGDVFDNLGEILFVREEP